MLLISLIRRTNGWKVGVVDVKRDKEKDERLGTHK